MVVVLQAVINSRDAASLAIVVVVPDPTKTSRVVALVINPSSREIISKVAAVIQSREADQLANVPEEFDHLELQELVETKVATRVAINVFLHRAEVVVAADVARVARQAMAT